jgi:hypothetical protein
MNETTITARSNWSKDDREFADIIIMIVEHRHAKYEREYQEGKESKRVPLADIKLCAKNFEHYIPKMEEIAKMQGIDRNQPWKVTAENMLERFCQKGELEVYTEFPLLYMLNKEGILYRDFIEKLEDTP